MGRRTEAALTGGGGCTGGDRDCNHRLRDPPCLSHLLQVPGEIPIGVGRRLAGSGAQLTEGAAEVEVTVQGVGKGGHGCPYLGKNICGGVLGSSTVWVGDVGDDTAYWEGFGWIPPQGGPQTDGTETLEGGGW